MRINDTTTHHIGRTDDGDRVYVEIRLSEHKPGKPVRFTDLTEGDLIHELGISGFVIGKGYRHAHGAGQVVSDVRQVTEFAKGWTAEDVKSLLAIWKEWHLNQMNEASDEQRAAGITYTSNPDHVDSNGYKIGSAWLARQIPGDVLEEVHRLSSLPSGKIPASY
jgi:hypothetical protein